LLGFENIPNFEGINSYGLRSKEHKLEKDKNTFRILILGDSIAEGFATSFFENLLNESSLLHSKYKFEVWNGAVGAYDIRRYYLYLKNKGLHYKPDLVFIFFCLNDFFIDTSVYYKDEKGVVQYSFHTSSELMRRYTPHPFLMRYSYFYRFIILRLNNYLLGMEEKRRGVSLEEEEGRYYLGRIKDICHKKNLPLFAVLFPYLKPPAEYDSYQQKHYKVITRALKDFDIAYLDLHSYLPQKELISLRAKPEDEIHPSREGHRLIAKIIYGYFSDTLYRNRHFK
jgi:lysophospholipase L1-like esterase